MLCPCSKVTLCCEPQQFQATHAYPLDRETIAKPSSALHRGLRDDTRRPLESLHRLWHRGQKCVPRLATIVRRSGVPQALHGWPVLPYTMALSWKYPCAPSLLT